MPYVAGNGVPVIIAGYTPRSTFQWPFLSRHGAMKLDVFANGTDVIVQTVERDEAFQDDVTQEILIPQGFNSIEFPTPIYQWRFKVWIQTLLAASGTVHYRALA